MLRAALTCAVATAALSGLGVAHAVAPPAPPPIGPGDLPKGHSTRCTMKGPHWLAYGVHTPNAPPAHGNRYRVTAWGITCAKAREYLRAFFPKIPAHPMGELKGGPAGFTCKGIDPPGTVTKNRMHDGSCRREDPPATFHWEPTGGKRGRSSALSPTAR